MLKSTSTYSSARARWLALPLVVAALLAGCGSEPPPAPPATSAPTTATPNPASPPLEEAPATAATTPAHPSPQTSVATTSEPALAEQPMSEPVAAAQGPEPQEGVDYTRIDPPAPMSPDTGKIEVAEVFAYSCIHCATMQNLITPWKSALPADVEFRYVPMAHGQAEVLARAFYASEAMGVLDRVHEKLFQAIAVERKLKQGTPEALADLYAEFGVERETLLSTMKSFAVGAQVARAQKSVARWGIEGTPTLIVAGKYRVSANLKGHEGMLATVEKLIARERAAMGTKPPS